MSFTIEDFKTENPESTEETNTETIEASAESTPEEVATPETTPEESAEITEAEVAAYEANYGYEVKGEKKEFAEFLRGSITNLEQENELRDMYTRALGMDEIKESRTKLESEFQQYQTDVNTQFAPVVQRGNDFDNAVKMGNLATAFEIGGIKEEEVFNHLLRDPETFQRLEQKLHTHYQNMEQGSQGQYQESLQTQHTNKGLTTQLESTQAQLAAMQTQMENMAYQSGTMKHQALIASQEALMGPGSFLQAAKQYGHNQWQAGVQIPQDQLIDSYVNAMGFQAPVQQEVNPSAIPAQPIQQVAQQVEAQPVVPIVGGSINQSVVAQPAATMNDFRASLQKLA
jgi:hypothetical protein